jgi:hypothetical protein
MKNLLFKILILIIILFPVQYSSAQNIRPIKKAGLEAWEKGNYYGAAQLLEQVLRKDSSDVDLAYKYALANYHIREYKEASTWFRQVFLLDSSQYPKSLFYRAYALKSLGKYEQARKEFIHFKELAGHTDSLFSEFTNHEIRTCEFLTDSLSTIPHDSKLSIQTIGKSVNSKYSEYGFVPYQDTLVVFSATRPDKQDSTMFQTRIYHAKNRNEAYRSVNVFSPVVTDTNKQYSNVSFSGDFRTMYYSVCPGNSADENSESCKIFKIRYISGQWQEPEALPEPVNLSGSNSRQPQLVSVGNREYLFFASDRVNGHGKHDIWFCRIFPEGTTGEAINAGPQVNSPSDEITPHYDNEDSVLYFSSGWHVNLGGFDIFRSDGLPGNFSLPENIGIPVNTSYDDVYFKINRKHKRAYFSSNRPGSLAFRNEACCNDIYFYDLSLEEIPAEDEEIADETIPTDSLLTYTGEKDSAEHTSFELKLNSYLTDKNVYPDIKKGEYSDVYILSLYFDNDKPNPNSYQTSTSKEYTELAEDYVARKELFTEQYIADRFGMSRIAAEDSISVFFDQSVKSSVSRLEIFSDRLLRSLNQGNEIHLVLKAYASPLSTSGYNLNLTKRRIASVINYFREFKGGALKQYMKNKEQLTISRIPLGESKSPADVNDSKDIISESIYSPEASRQRKVDVYIRMWLE